MSIESFKNRESEEIANGKQNKRTMKILPREAHFSAYKKLIFLDNTNSLTSLRAWAGLRLEALRGNRKGQWSIRINNQYRICFRFDDGRVFDVEVTDYH